MGPAGERPGAPAASKVSGTEQATSDAPRLPLWPKLLLWALVIAGGSFYLDAIREKAAEDRAERAELSARPPPEPPPAPASDSVAPVDAAGATAAPPAMAATPAAAREAEDLLAVAPPESLPSESPPSESPPSAPAPASAPAPGAAGTVAGATPSATPALPPGPEAAVPGPIAESRADRMRRYQAGQQRYWEPWWKPRREQWWEPRRDLAHPYPWHPPSPYSVPPGPYRPFVPRSPR